MTIPPFPTDPSPCDMTLRDYFAAKAIPSIMIWVSEDDGEIEWKILAQQAYMMADAMLAQREKS